MRIGERWSNFKWDTFNFLPFSHLLAAHCCHVTPVIQLWTNLLCIWPKGEAQVERQSCFLLCRVLMRGTKWTMMAVVFDLKAVNWATTVPSSTHRGEMKQFQVGHFQCSSIFSSFGSTLLPCDACDTALNKPALHLAKRWSTGGATIIYIYIRPGGVLSHGYPQLSQISQPNPANKPSLRPALPRCRSTRARLPGCEWKQLAKCTANHCETKCVHIVFTLWWTNIAMENGHL